MNQRLGSEIHHPNFRDHAAAKFRCWFRRIQARSSAHCATIASGCALARLMACHTRMLFRSQALHALRSVGQVGNGTLTDGIVGKLKTARKRQQNVVAARHRQVEILVRRVPLHALSRTRRNA